MSEMTSHESWERYWEGLGRAASCCRELGIMTKITAWGDLSKQLLIMRKKGQAIYKGPSLTEVQVLALVTDMEIAQKLAAMMGQNG